MADGAAAAAAAGEFRLVCQLADRLCDCQGLSASERERQLIPRTLLAVLRREDELRMCMPVQALYDQYELPHPEIEAELQRVALAEHGLCRCWVVDTMHNPFFKAFGAWPEGHVVIGAEATLLLCTEAREGEGCVAGGEWQMQVEGVLSKVCDCTPCNEIGSPLPGACA